jgi:uncharacterized protein DUF6894
MPDFHFHLRADGTLFRDPDGTQLPDLAAARLHGARVAEELMLNSDAAKRHWSLCVEDDVGERQLDVFFVDVDPSLAEFPPPIKMLASQTCRRFGALIDTMCDIRATMIESRILLARARGKPRLVCYRGA